MSKNNDTEIYNVRASEWNMDLEIETFFDDPFTEACTRCMEIKMRCPTEASVNATAVMICTSRSTEEVKTLNTYKILQNAGFAHKSEFLRKHFIENCNIDMATEPLSSTK
jgi:epoxyqueuosine reductase QueG